MPKQSQDVPARIGLGEIVERERAGTESGIFGEGVVDKRRQRDENKPDRDDDAADQQNVGQVQTRSEPTGGSDARQPVQTCVGDAHSAFPSSEIRAHRPLNSWSNCRCHRRSSSGAISTVMTFFCVTISTIPGGFHCTSLRVGTRLNLPRNCRHSPLTIKLPATPPPLPRVPFPFP